MYHQNNCNHSNCVTSTNESVRQTLSEMDWERGIWNAGKIIFIYIILFENFNLKIGLLNKK